MQHKPNILIFCHDLVSVRIITDAAERYFDLRWVRDARQWCSSLSAENPPAAALLDNAAATVAAIPMLQAVQKSLPAVKRILLSDYCDLALIVQGIHTGAVQQIVYKPIHPSDLLSSLGATGAAQTSQAANLRSTASLRAVG